MTEIDLLMRYAEFDFYEDGRPGAMDMAHSAAGDYSKAEAVTPVKAISPDVLQKNSLNRLYEG